MDLSELVACTLSDSDLKSQQERWLALGESFGLGRQETNGLVAVENECCSWADWSVEAGDDVLVMAARSEGAGVETLHAMFTQFA